MPKAGSGFMRAAGNAAKAIFGGRGGRDWSLYNIREGVQKVQQLFGNAYRSKNPVYEVDSRGHVKDTGKGFGRFADRAEALAYELAKDVRVIDRNAERDYNAMRRWAGQIKASAAERREFELTYRGEKLLAGRGNRFSGDASEVARQMAGQGLIGHDVASMGNNVDIMNAINNALNATKNRISTPVRTTGGSTDDYVGDIFMGLMERYQGVVNSANRRRK